MQESFRTREPILSLRRVVLGMDLRCVISHFSVQIENIVRFLCRHKAEIGQYWLKSAQIAQRYIDIYAFLQACS